MDKERLSRLVGGDLLLIPSLRGMCFSAVLRVGSSGELYLSHVSVKQVAGEAQALSNPFSWDDDVGALVDRDGDVPLWYSSGIDVEQAGATKQALAYASTPRAENAKYAVSGEDMTAFMNDPRYAALSGIVGNGEAGGMVTQLSLALDLMGKSHTKEELIGLAWFVEHCSMRRAARDALVIAAIAMDSEVSGLATPAAPKR